MRVIIPVTTHYAEDFIQWLIKRIKSKILLRLNLKKLYSATVYQKKFKRFEPYNNTVDPIDFVQVIKQGVSLITYKRVKDNWIIYIPESQVYEGYYASVYTLCKFVDNGCSDLKGYPIFTKTLKGVAANISKYYAQFLQEFVL